jgi:death on curing protein
VTLIEGIALNHPFQDGNKRTAIIVGLTFLQTNGAIIQASNDELGRQIESLVITKDTFAFSQWMRAHLIIKP